MSLRIMHISTRLILGGSQENTVLSCEGQVADGLAVSLVYGPIYGPEGSLLERARSYRSPHPGPLPEGEGGGIECIETPHLVRELNPARDALAWRDLKKLIRDWKPDVVHTHSSKAGVLGRAAAWSLGVPCVVHTIHGLPFHPYLPKWRNAIYIASEKWAAKRCHAIVCVADAMRDQALAAGVGRREQFVTVYSGMEVDRYLHPEWSRAQSRRDLGFNDDNFVLGTVARLAELKGHDDLLNALQPVMNARPNLKLLWVGDGWWRDRLLGRVKEMGLADRVLTTGLVPSEEIPRYLAAMDCLAHPSYREGLPRTVTQALLSGLPVIAYDVDGAPEVCMDGVTGKLVEPGDHAGLRESVEWMMDHPAERTAMGERGQARCRVRFSTERMVEHLQCIYDAVLDGSYNGPSFEPAALFADERRSEAGASSPEPRV